MHNRRFRTRAWLFLVLAVASPVAVFGDVSSTNVRSAVVQEDANLSSLVEDKEELLRRMTEERLTDLHVAAESGNETIVSQLIKQGAAVDTRDRWSRTPLHFAAEFGRMEIVKKLLDCGADVNAKTKLNETPLFFAARHVSLRFGDSYSPAIADVLLSAGATINVTNDTGLTPLHIVAGAEDGAGLVERLIKGGADVNAAEEFGDTPLHSAVFRKSAATVKVLLAAGANVHAVGRGGCTPLHSAAFSGDAAVVKLLLEAKAGANALDRDGESPLHHVSPFRESNSDWVNLMLKAGAKVNAKSADGQTPLHKAAAAGSVGVIERLLRGGADANVEDAEGRTPLDMTEANEFPVPENRMKQCIALLKENGGKPGSKKAKVKR